MVRGKRKPLDDELKNSKILSTIYKIDKENETLNALLKQKRDEQVKIFYNTILDANISVDEALEVIRQYTSLDTHSIN